MAAFVMSTSNTFENSGMNNFEFVSVQTPGDAKDRVMMRRARSHAVSRGLENKRRLQQKSRNIFRLVGAKEVSTVMREQKKTSHMVTPLSSTLLLSTEPLGVFQMLAAESPRLHILLSQHKSGQPVFSVSDELVLQNFQLVLRKSVDDSALLNAVMLTFVFAAGNCFNNEFLGYQGKALRSLQQKLSSPDGTATSESTLAVILLLAGIEARLGMPRQVQLHMRAIQQLLDLCRSKGVYLSDEIKRAIFWQDLNSSVMTGSSRVVDHTTFPEFRWIRDTLAPSFFVLPPGFQANSSVLSEEFVDVLKDVYALQCIRDYSSFSGVEDIIPMAQIDNHQASIQSRLVSLPNLSHISECCHLAAYLCSVMLRCPVWRASTIPSHLTLQLLCKLQQASNDAIWDDRPDLLAWLLYIGGAFSPTGTIRSDYVALLEMNRTSRFEGLYSSWPDLHRVLKHFIWSEDAFLAQVKAFWKETTA